MSRLTTLTLAALLTLTATLQAQSSRARLRGTAQDPVGAIIPNVEITAANQETGVTTRATTNSSGEYAFAALAPGLYTLSANPAGFKTYKRSGIRLETADAIDLDLTFELGNQTESVTITADTPLLESTSSSIGQMMDSRLMQEMPLNSLNLVATVGATVFLAGGRARNQNFILDGGNMQNVRLALGQVDTDPPVFEVHIPRPSQPRNRSRHAFTPTSPRPTAP